MQLHQKTLDQVLKELPDLIDLRPDGRHDGAFVCALGFEDRVLAVPRMLATSGYRADVGIVVEYPVKRDENEHRRPELVALLNQFCDKILFVPSASRAHGSLVADSIRSIAARRPGVTYDVSGSSSILLLPVLANLLRLECSLRITHSEPEERHPLRRDVESAGGADRYAEQHGAEDQPLLSAGVDGIYLAADYPGTGSGLAPFIVAFASNRRSRTEAVIREVDDRLVGDAKSQTWVMSRFEGEPWRAELQARLNRHPGATDVREVSALNYKDSVTLLHGMWLELQRSRRLIVSPLGTKMQDVGIALYYYMRPTFQVSLTEPRQYFPSAFSSGVGAVHALEFGDTTQLRVHLDALDNLYFKGARGELLDRWNPQTDETVHEGFIQ